MQIQVTILLSGTDVSTKKGIWPKNIKFHAVVKKCDFGDFSERVRMAVPC